MDTTIIVAIIGAAGSAMVAVLNQFLTGRVKAQESKLDKLYALSMSEDAFGQLKQLSTGNYGAFYLDPSFIHGLAGEITHFKILGYITFKGHYQSNQVKDTCDLPPGNHSNGNLSDYISVTPQGRTFIALREESLKNA